MPARRAGFVRTLLGRMSAAVGAIVYGLLVLCLAAYAAPVAAGNDAQFVNQSAQDTGLPVWTAADRSIEDTDLVLWHVFGIHHVPRPEDWPVMPVDIVRFELKPVGFFDRNPALDVPPTTPASGAHCH